MELVESARSMIDLLKTSAPYELHKYDKEIDDCMRLISDIERRMNTVQTEQELLKLQEMRTMTTLFSGMYKSWAHRESSTPLEQAQALEEKLGQMISDSRATTKSYLALRKALDDYNPVRPEDVQDFVEESETMEDDCESPEPASSKRSRDDDWDEDEYFNTPNKKFFGTRSPSPDAEDCEHAWGCRSSSDNNESD
jgi:hypothetical protein